MTQRNIHGEWSMKLEGRFLLSEVVGSTNKEAAHAWLIEVKQLITNSQGGIATPWVILLDAREWGMTMADASDDSIENVMWPLEHHCVFFAFVFSKKIHIYTAHEQLKSEIENVAYFFDFDEAYQTCLDKLAETQSPKNK
ncbi:hypothetical protein L4C34_05835 [Vibrio profundum]|uniref:hypothetical protein n=1 Tax=Vibrio profundum TaxID=2910247 RepID=UPI003D0F1BEE